MWLRGSSGLRNANWTPGVAICSGVEMQTGRGRKLPSFLLLWLGKQIQLCVVLLWCFDFAPNFFFSCPSRKERGS